MISLLLKYIETFMRNATHAINFSNAMPENINK